MWYKSFDLLKVFYCIIALVAKHPAESNYNNLENQPFVEISKPVNCLSFFQPLEAKVTLTIFDRSVDDHFSGSHWLDDKLEGGWNKTHHQNCEGKIVESGLIIFELFALFFMKIFLETH